MHKSVNLAHTRSVGHRSHRHGGDGQIYECDLLACDQVSRSSVCGSADDIEHSCALSYHTPHVSYENMKLHFTFRIYPFLI